MENKIQMIVTDLDKSLLDNQRQITDYTKNIFQECIKNGIIIVFATARPYRATKIFYDIIKPDALICHGGAIVYINDKQVFNIGIKHNVVKDILWKIYENYPYINLAIESNDKIFTNFDPSKYWVDILYETLDIENLPETAIDKIIIGLESIKNINELKNYLHKGLYLEISENTVGIIMNKKASKWNGIKKLLKYYKVKNENTVAFGDDYNDIEMVENCGTGVAVENGIMEVKKIAKYICGNNNEDGIAKWINENILEKGQTST